MFFFPHLSQLTGVPGGFYSAPSQMCSSLPCRTRWGLRPLLRQTQKRRRRRIWVIHKDDMRKGWVTQIRLALGKRNKATENSRDLLIEIILCRYNVVMLIFFFICLTVSAVWCLLLLSDWSEVAGWRRRRVLRSLCLIADRGTGKQKRSCITYPRNCPIDLRSWIRCVFVCCVIGHSTDCHKCFISKQKGLWTVLLRWISKCYMVICPFHGRHDLLFTVILWPLTYILCFVLFLFFFFVLWFVTVCDVLCDSCRCLNEFWMKVESPARSEKRTSSPTTATASWSVEGLPDSIQVPIHYG